jgi:hypothetical protein
MSQPDRYRRRQCIPERVLAPSLSWVQLSDCWWTRSVTGLPVGQSLDVRLAQVAIPIQPGREQSPSDD